jgi:hypothetical protein
MVHAKTPREIDRYHPFGVAMLTPAMLRSDEWPPALGMGGRLHPGTGGRLACNPQETTGEITTVGLDLAKNVLHLVGCDSRGKEVERKMLTRGKLAAYVANLPACLIAMAACGGAHHWARRSEALGHEVCLIFG